MKNLPKIILLLVLALNCVYLDMYAAGKRKAAQAPEDEILLLKRSRPDGDAQQALDFALFQATANGLIASVATKLAQKANPNALTLFDYEQTPLHIAARRNDLMCLRLLHQYGANVNVVADYFQTPLHEAMYVFNAETGVACIEFFLKNGARANAKNYAQDTPLHLAVKFGHVEYVQVLLEFDADRTLRNAEGKTPLMIAEEKRFGAIIELLSGKKKISRTRKR